MNSPRRYAFEITLVVLFVLIAAMWLPGWSLVLVAPAASKGGEHRFDLPGGAGSIHVAFEDGGVTDAITTVTSAHGKRSVRSEGHGIPFGGAAIAIDASRGVAILRVVQRTRYPSDPIAIAPGTYVLAADGSSSPAGVADRLALNGAQHRGLVGALAAVIAGLLVTRLVKRGRTGGGSNAVAAEVLPRHESER